MDMDRIDHWSRCRCHAVAVDCCRRRGNRYHSPKQVKYPSSERSASQRLWNLQIILTFCSTLTNRITK